VRNYYQRAAAANRDTPPKPRNGVPHGPHSG